VQKDASIVTKQVASLCQARRARMPIDENHIETFIPGGVNVVLKAGRAAVDHRERRSRQQIIREIFHCASSAAGEHVAAARQTAENGLAMDSTEAR